MFWSAFFFRTLSIKVNADEARALEILKFKLDVLWQMNDAMGLAYGVAA